MGSSVEGNVGYCNGVFLIGLIAAGPLIQTGLFELYHKLDELCVSHGIL